MYHAPPMDRDEALQLENQVRVILRDGGDLRDALARIDRVVAAYPRSTHGLALRAMVLSRLGQSPETERALAAAFEAGLAPPRAGGEASVITIVRPALDLANYLDAAGRRPDAVAVIDRALAVVPHEHATLLLQARERLTGSANAGFVLPPQVGPDPYAHHELLTFEQMAQRVGVKLPPGMKAPEQRKPSSGIESGSIVFIVLVGVGSLVVLGGLIRLVLYLLTGQ
ncbi:Hypothetical protein A7982_06443 [Minicystis rosea]|nr:Hypothetical protein A7982_06443 [Minicystis rosea]